MRISIYREIFASQITLRFALLGMRAALQRPSQLTPRSSILLAPVRDVVKAFFARCK
jgi:hypothetical protein